MRYAFFPSFLIQVSLVPLIVFSDPTRTLSLFTSRVENDFPFLYLDAWPSEAAAKQKFFLLFPPLEL